MSIRVAGTLVLTSGAEPEFAISAAQQLSKTPMCGDERRTKGAI
jgi:hypothetical protein